MKQKKLYGLMMSLVVLSMMLSACQAQRIVETVVVTEIVEKEGTPVVIERVVTPTAPPPAAEAAPASPDNRAEVVRMAMLSDMDGTNPWYYYDITGSSYWNTVVMYYYWPTLYNISDQRWDLIPYLADGWPGEFSKEGDLYVADVKLKEGLKWSDGSPLTAEDVAYTAEVVLAFALAGNWVGYYNPELLDRVEAVDPLTIRFFWKIQPGIPVWQYGALQGPIVNKAFWEPKVAELLLQAKALDQSAADFLDKVGPLQQSLEAIDNSGEPSYGPYQARLDQELILAIRQSAAEGGAPVKLPLDPARQTH